MPRSALESLRRLLPAFLALATSIVVASPARAQDWRPTRKAAPTPPYARRAPVVRAPAIVTAGLNDLVNEAEPNNGTATATPITLGDTVSGVIDPVGDLDFYAVQLEAGTRVELTVIARLAGSPLDPVLAFIDTDGTVLAFNDDAIGFDSRLVFTVTRTGRYFVGVGAFLLVGDAEHVYRLSVGTLATGPGDPTTLFASGLGVPVAIAAAPGALYVLDGSGADVVHRVDAQGVRTAFAVRPGVDAPSGIAVDGNGDLLVTGQDATGGVIVRLGQDGRRTVFRDGLDDAHAIAVGPDGDVWVADNVARVIRRFDPAGGPKGTIAMGAAVPVQGMAFSPAGFLHVTDGLAGVHRLSNQTMAQVIEAQPFVDGLAFDAAGRLYVANGARGTVTLYDASYAPITAIFASTNLGGPIALAFLRDASGTMTSRLVAANFGAGILPPFAGGVVEMRAGSVMIPGFRVGADLLRIANATLRDATVGAEVHDTLRLAVPSGATTWSIVTGTLPPGVTLAATGVLSGIPEEKGTYAVTVRATTPGALATRDFTLAVGEPALDVAQAAAHLLGAPGTLAPPLERFLDLQGNRNGRADIGDLRAYLKAQGQLPGASRTTTDTPPRAVTP